IDHGERQQAGQGESNLGTVSEPLMAEPAPPALLPLMRRSICFEGSSRRGLLRLPANGRTCSASSPGARRRPLLPLRTPTR
uniref:Uncharacterized protein n=1 Tax=Aegilops tauschii subsp. strangulata TaxID=200361 RepID=A0A453NC87_AEGTS